MFEKNKFFTFFKIKKIKKKYFYKQKIFNNTFEFFYLK